MAKKSPLKILIAYEDLDSGVRAKKISERVAMQLDPGFNFQSHLYKFGFLDHPQLREEAILEASMADLIIISTNDAGELPGHVKTWIEEWLPCRRKGQSALVALLGRDDADSWAASVTRAYLQQMAVRGQMDFFCKTDWPGELHATARPTSQIESDAPMLVGGCGDSRWHGWGLND